MSEMIKEFKKGDLLYIGDNKKAYWGLPQGYPYKEQSETVIEWDGNTEGRPGFGDEVSGAYKVSDEVFDNLAGCPITFIAGDEIMELTLSEGVEAVNNIYVYGDGVNQRSVLVVLGENVQNLETGTYFFKNSMPGNIMYVSKLIGDTEIIHPISTEFLPGGEVIAELTTNKANYTGEQIAEMAKRGVVTMKLVYNGLDSGSRYVYAGTKTDQEVVFINVSSEDTTYGLLTQYASVAWTDRTITAGHRYTARAVADATGETVTAAKFNALLNALRDAGILATS